MLRRQLSTHWMSSMGKRGKTFDSDQIDDMLQHMRNGKTLTAIAAMKGMPSIDTMNRWEDEQDELGAAITRARAQGYTVRAEKAVDNAQSCDDPQKGRLAFDAERWFLGKMYPKKFGDKVQLADADGEKMQLGEVESLTRLAALASRLQGRLDAPDNAE